jgi:malate synthase
LEVFFADQQMHVTHLLTESEPPMPIAQTMTPSPVSRPHAGTSATQAWPAGVTLLAPIPPSAAGIMTHDALAFVASLHRAFNGRRLELLALRVQRQARLDNGERPDFLPQTQHLRDNAWTVAPIPADLLDRRVEITGPVDRKMIINALNSGAKVFMADLEDSQSPTWEGLVSGQVNLFDAVRRTIAFTGPDGKAYALSPTPAVLMVRPRGWHLPERHLLVDGEHVSGSLMDFALYFYHNARELLARGTGPYFYLPKLESHLEARLWNDVFVFAQHALGLPVGTIRATVLIETILAAFEMDEILYELRQHIVGLNCGRWDYIFSVIKKLHAHEAMLLPDRGQVTMNTHFLRSYSRLLIKTCHRRGAFAMGGMAAYIPVKGDASANDAAFAAVRADKQREAGDGHDGTWVAHPGLVPVAMQIFDQHLATHATSGTAPRTNQLDVLRDDVHVTAADLLTPPQGTISEAGIRNNAIVSIRYIESWLRGVGCVPLYNLMEDAATAEISRAQLWQWARHQRAVLPDGQRITLALIRTLAADELAKFKATLTPEAIAQSKLDQAATLFDRLISSDRFTEFLTLPAYEQLELV